jgi:N-terminal domain of reverse transcriptase
MGKLDAAAAAVVNGPEDELSGWHAVDWRAAEENVRRLRQRIFTASQAGDLKRVRSLQKLTAPRGALSYPRFSREEFEGRFLGLMPYPEPKGEGNHSMAGNWRSCPGVRNDALGDPRGMAKAELPEP